MARRAWRAAVHGVAELDTAEHVRACTHTRSTHTRACLPLSAALGAAHSVVCHVFTFIPFKILSHFPCYPFPNIWGFRGHLCVP